MQSARQRTKMFAQFVILLGLMLVIGAGLSNLKEVRQFFAHATYVPADVYVNTRAVLGPLPRPWRNLSQGGESHAWRIEPIANQVRALNPEYIRIDHIYDFYDVVSGSPGNYQYDWSKLDLVLQDIRSVDATPFISLSYMPTAMSDSDVVGAPQNYDDWQNLVRRTIEHISGELGFRDVYYEVWNEPDLFGGWKYYGNKNYLALYGAAARGAAAAQRTEAFKFGGPATTGLYRSWIDALLKYTSENQLRLDFISWHLYTYDLDQYKVDLAQAREWVSKYPQYSGVIEYLITEWGHNSDMDPGYDGKLGAAHTVASAITMVGTIKQGFIFEIQDGADPNNQAYWGRWGLLTANEHGARPKPRYSALLMLDRLSDQRLQTLGQGSMVKALSARTPDGTIQTVLANFDPKNVNYETVPITYQGTMPGIYDYTLETLSGERRSGEASTNTTQLQIFIPLPPNEVAFIELRQR